ncbi:hypothetical protein MAPG_00860 [Magnaporthiopsis poae ATCC 64411]|uniref:TRAPP complex protein TRS85 n=1 Tax=Magnaporthiopsis poae (strain ATCC 64411 / 73-15) TaxID=644358 RepID=A0A0C4DM58_MAGP6|nr:hypothetical protein MAPG_00860 [Magnaporthiopsis poae ATCC 64411]
MQSSENGSPAPDSIKSLPMAASSIRLPSRRQPLDDLAPLSHSDADLASLPRRANPSVASLYASTLTPPGSRSASPAGRQSLLARNPLGAAAASVFAKSLVDNVPLDSPGDPLALLLQAFVPHVAVFASADTDALAADKGFERGLWELLRPFGEQVQGKVSIRDSVGGSRTWDDYAVRFVRYGENDGYNTPLQHSSPSTVLSRPSTAPNGSAGSAGSPDDVTSRESRRLAEVEAVVDRHLTYAEQSTFGIGQQPMSPTQQEMDLEATSPYYSLYLRRLLSGIPLESHETFSHPVACVMAISSRNPSPIDALRNLYKETSEGEGRLPDWVAPDYLRYYVLVHDEENGDISKSMALFEQMKRNFGLHCHLLRIRSTQCAETDDDSIPLPRSEWMSAAEELADIRKSEAQEHFEDPTKYLFETDATAIRTFVREMVIQSIVPTMERNVSVWNDQVAAKRKGFGGRLVSMSRRWAFGGGSKNAPGGSNYSQGFYRPDTPEATLRRLADYAFMLRDWKLAQSTYGLLRPDFESDHAWRHHAAANEMGALAVLIMAHPKASVQTQAKTLESAAEMLREAAYSYQTRCGAPYGALRSSVLGLELLRLRGGASVLAAEAWLGLGKFLQTQRCLNEARVMYSMLQSDDGIASFALASEFMAGLNSRLKEGLAAASVVRDKLSRSTGGADSSDDEVFSEDEDRTGRTGGGGGGAAGKRHDAEGEEEDKIDEEEVEVSSSRRSRRQSLLNSGNGGAGGSGVGGPPETSPLSPLQPFPSKKDDVAGKGDFG